MIRPRSKKMNVKRTSRKSPAAHPVESGTFAGNLGHADDELRIVTNRLQGGDAIYNAIVNASETRQRQKESLQKQHDHAEPANAEQAVNPAEKACPPVESGTFAGNVGHEIPPANDREAVPGAVDLTPRIDHEKKQLALCALLRGASNTGAAKEAGVDRRTVFRWRQDVEFQAELHRMQSGYSNLLRSLAAELLDDSIDVIKEAVDLGRITPALQLVQSLKILGGQSLAEIDGLDHSTKLEPAVAFPAPMPAAPIQSSTENTSEASTSTPNVQFASDTTESVKSQIQAEPIDLEDLPYNQQLTIVKLISGNSVVEAATDMNIAATSIERWMRDDEAFRQVLRRCRQEQVQRLQCKLLWISTDALLVLKSALRQQRNIRVAFAVLRGLGLIK